MAAEYAQLWEFKARTAKFDNPSGIEQTTARLGEPELGGNVSVEMRLGEGDSPMADLSPKQLRILKVLKSASVWLTRGQMEDHAGRKGFSLALGAATREIRAGSLEQLGYVERRDKTTPFEYCITELGEAALFDYERVHGEVPLAFTPPPSPEVDL